MATITVVQSGAEKANGGWPYTICIIANPWIEAPEGSGKFVADPIVLNQDSFNERAGYILQSVFGRLPGQAEAMLAGLADQFRVISVFDPDRPRLDRNALVAHDNTNIVVARQNKFAPFLKTITVDGMGKLRADVAFAVTASASHDRSSAWYTQDNEGLDGRDFMIDDLQMTHRPDNTMPGTVALHVSAVSIVALHEFGHAASSWSNGLIGDLYVDGGIGLNKRRPGPIPAQFCVYDGIEYASSTTRGGTLAYPADWVSYHPALSDPAYPAVMDDFWQAADGPEKCQHDRLTRQFLLDRIQAIMSR